MRILLITLLLLGLVNCTNPNDEQHDIPTPKVFAEYYIRYLQGEKQLKAEAIFKKGIHRDSAKNIEPEGSIFVQDIQLMPVQINKENLRYQKNFNRVFEPEYNFRFVDDQDQQAVDHPIQMSSIDNISIENNTCSKSKGFTVHWEGKLLKENEQMLVILTDSKTSVSSHLMAGPKSKNSCMFPTTIMNTVSTGKGFVYLVKKQMNTFEKDALDIHSLAEFYTNKIDVDIVD